jgi:ribonuclease J
MSMQLTIHRGTDEIGGSCVELRSGEHRLILDLGLPLADKKGEPFKLDRKLGIDALITSGILPNIQGFYKNAEPDPKIALVISHAHQDHYGLAGFVHPKIDKYATEGTLALLDVCKVFLPHALYLQSTKEIGASFQHGPFTVAAFPVDHSAPDSAAFAITAGERTVIYTGDFRGDGPRGWLFDNLKTKLPKQPDAMLMEGTMLDNEKGRHCKDERDVVKELTAVFRQQTNLSIVFCAGQNIGRLVSVFKAAKTCRKTLIMDPYTAYVLHSLAARSNKLPQYWWTGVRIMAWPLQRQRLLRWHKERFISALRKQEIESAEIKKDPAKYVLLGRTNGTFDDIAGKLEPKGLELIWSMWSGYWKNDKRVRPFCERHGIKQRPIHAGGHATVEHLKELVAAVNPNRLIPIHTNVPRSFTTAFSEAPVQLLKNGEWLDLA